MVDFNKDTLDLISQILLDYDLFLISKHTIPIDKEAKLIKEFFQEKYPEISSQITFIVGEYLSYLTFIYNCQRFNFLSEIAPFKRLSFKQKIKTMLKEHKS